MYKVEVENFIGDTKAFMVADVPEEYNRNNAIEYALKIKKRLDFLNLKSKIKVFNMFHELIMKIE